jgi:quercetin dioxygenase-like cupin family protein
MSSSKPTGSTLMTDLARRRAGIGAMLLFTAFVCWAASTAWSQSHDHKMVTPGDLKWGDVPSLPKGAMAAEIEGPMDKAVPFTVRIKVPANYKIPPHSHPAVERVTVLSGTLNMGLGDKFDETKKTALSPGSVMLMQPNTNHFAWTETETVIQLHGTGPWGINYVNPADDPRKKHG